MPRVVKQKQHKKPSTRLPNKPTTAKPKQKLILNNNLALCLDLRVTESLEGDAVGDQLVSNLSYLLQGAFSRGCLPISLATTFNNRDDVYSKVENRVAVLNRSNFDQVKLEPTFIIPTMGATMKSQPDTCTLLTEMVELTLGEATQPMNDGSKSQHPNKLPSSLHITVVTHDRILHDYPLDVQKLCENMSKKQDLIQSLTLVLLESGYNQSYTSESPMTSTIMSQENENKLQGFISENHTSSSSTEIATRFNSYSTNLALNAKCAILENHHVTLTPLLRDWTSCLIPKSTMTLPLPETPDGSVCSLSLSLEFNLLPYPIHSQSHQRLVSEMKEWERGDWSVLYTMSIDSIDSTLLFGVPFRLRCANLSDWNEFTEMSSLVREFWSWLGHQDVAAVLKWNNKGTGLESEVADWDHQYFLLMTDSYGPGTKSSSNKNNDMVPIDSSVLANGIMYRYAAQDQLLCEVTEEQNVREREFSMSQASKMSEDAESENQYYDYIDRSMDYIERVDLLNPVFLPNRITTKPKQKGTRRVTFDVNDEEKDGTGTVESNLSTPGTTTSSLSSLLDDSLSTFDEGDFSMPSPVPARKATKSSSKKRSKKQDHKKKQDTVNVDDVFEYS